MIRHHFAPESWDCNIFCRVLPLTLNALHSEDLESPGKIEVRATLMSSERENAMLESMVQRLNLEPGITACLLGSRATASPGLGVDPTDTTIGAATTGYGDRGDGLGRLIAGMSGASHLRALPQRLPSA
jgi:hypothetical protein